VIEYAVWLKRRRRQTAPFVLVSRRLPQRSPVATPSGVIEVRPGSVKHRQRMAFAPRTA